MKTLRKILTAITVTCVPVAYLILEAAGKRNP